MICNKLNLKQSLKLYLGVLKDNDTETMRRLAREDLFFLIYVVFARKDINHPWLYDRCREVEREPNGHLDLWAREHYKSTIITYALTIQDILCSHGMNPIRWDKEITVGIFSHTRPIAKKFLQQIKRELEENTMLKGLFPDVLYKDPRKEAPKWSEDTGIIVKRKSNPKEATVEAWGLVDGQPTATHFDVLIFDDTVSRESVTTPDQISKTTDSWALALNLGSHIGVKRYIGTRYHYNDTYREMIAREAAIPRIYPATNDGTLNGLPVLLKREKLSEKRREMGPYIFSCQMLQSPTEDSVMGFKADWLMFYDRIESFRGWNFYLISDPANEKKKENDFTVQLVIGAAPDNNLYLVDGIRDRLNLTERTRSLFRLHRRWKPLKTGYEQYGMQSDIQHIQYVQEQDNYRFSIIPLGGNTPKRTRILGDDQIQGLVPVFEQHRFWLPHQLIYADYEGKGHDLIKEFIDNEYLAFPVAVHDDILDCMARINDPALGAEFPMLEDYVLSAALGGSKQMAQTEYNLFGA